MKLSKADIAVRTIGGYEVCPAYTTTYDGRKVGIYNQYGQWVLVDVRTGVPAIFLSTRKSILHTIPSFDWSKIDLECDMEEYMDRTNKEQQERDTIRAEEDAKQKKKDNNHKFHIQCIEYRRLGKFQKLVHRLQSMAGEVGTSDAVDKLVDKLSEAINKDVEKAGERLYSLYKSGLK